MSVIILTYHGVTDVESTGIENFQGKHIPSKRFESQMHYLYEHETLLRLSDVVAAYTSGEELEGVVVSFDDAYRNNWSVALPILERYQIPTTFFLSTGFIGVERMFWVDEVEFVVDHAVVDSVDLSDHGLKRFPVISREDKMTAVTAIKAFLKEVSDRQKEQLLQQFRRRVPLKPNAKRSPNCQTLTWEHVQFLAKSPLVSIGAHSVDHTILSRIDGERLRYQVEQSRRDLERHLDREVTLFAYPNGGPGDYNGEVIEAVRAAGFRCGCTTLPGLNTAATDLFELRRSMVGFCGEPFPFPAAVRGA